MTKPCIAWPAASSCQCRYSIWLFIGFADNFVLQLFFVFSFSFCLPVSGLVLALQNWILLLDTGGIQNRLQLMQGYRQV